MIYLDNNGTTKLCKEGKNEMMKWLDVCSNPSSGSAIAVKTKKAIDHARKYILTHCGTNDSEYSVIFNSGASESNSFILRSISDAYKIHTNKIPHIITSTIEHNSILDCCKSLEDNKRAVITYIQPNAYGCISPASIAAAIKDNTALVTIMHANNEIGSINNIKRIGEVANSRNIPFHTDAVQTFGKYRIKVKEHNIDALSMSFHKLYGPMGLGMLIIKNDLITGYDLKSQISGTQQSNLRGGTENVPAILSAVVCMKCVFRDRDNKNRLLLAKKIKIIDGISAHIRLGEYKSYFNNQLPTVNEFIVLGPDHKEYNSLPNTLLLSFVKNTPGPPFCNGKLKKALDKKKIIVSIGSACATANPNASHVLTAIKAPLRIKQGVIRISMSDSSTDKEINTFINTIVPLANKQLNML